MNIEELYLALQICDASFGGSLSHSMGLESALNLGVISSFDSTLHKFILITLENV
jgi:urease accessory protein UreF